MWNYMANNDSFKPKTCCHIGAMWILRSGKKHFTKSEVWGRERTPWHHDNGTSFLIKCQPKTPCWASSQFSGAISLLNFSPTRWRAKIHIGKQFFCSLNNEGTGEHLTDRRRWKGYNWYTKGPSWALTFFTLQICTSNMFPCHPFPPKKKQHTTSSFQTTNFLAVTFAVLPFHFWEILTPKSVEIERSKQPPPSKGLAPSFFLPCVLWKILVVL